MAYNSSSREELPSPGFCGHTHKCASGYTGRDAHTYLRIELFFFYKKQTNKWLRESKVSVHKEQRTGVTGMALTSPSGPRAGSPPSAFSSAFCKTTQSSVMYTSKLQDRN